VHSNQSSSFVESRRHAYLMSASGVRLSVPTNSKIVELVPVAGARSMSVSGGLASSVEMTSHS
jgi:hypothetical protein